MKDNLYYEKYFNVIEHKACYNIQVNNNIGLVYVHLTSYKFILTDNDYLNIITHSPRVKEKKIIYIIFVYIYMI